MRKHILHGSNGVIFVLLQLYTHGGIFQSNESTVCNTVFQSVNEAAHCARHINDIITILESDNLSVSKFSSSSLYLSSS